jgi:hypothetical protein
MQLRKLGCALFVMLASTPASALSLGEGQILSRVGEPFSASIPLAGQFSRDVSFSQVKGAECRASIIGGTANGCESLYEAKLNFAIKRRSDGQYYLKVSGGRSDELFYRLLIKTTSNAGGTVYNSFEFLPEFGVSPDGPPTADVDAGLSPGQYGVVGGKIIETVTQEVEVVKPVKLVKAEPLKVKLPAEMAVKAAPASPKPVENRLQIKKVGEYADDIHALQKENGEIEAQIVLLEKHIGLLKEVIRLKSQAGAVPVSAVPAVVAVAAPLPASERLPGILTWILLAVVGVLAAAIVWMFMKMKQLSLSPGGTPDRQEAISPATLSEIKSLDLTGAFIKPKW